MVRVVRVHESVERNFIARKIVSYIVQNCKTDVEFLLYNYICIEKIKKSP